MSIITSIYVLILTVIGVGVNTRMEELDKTIVNESNRIDKLYYHLRELEIKVNELSKNSTK